MRKKAIAKAAIVILFLGLGQFANAQTVDQDGKTLKDLGQLDKEIDFAKKRQALKELQNAKSATGGAAASSISTADATIPVATPLKKIKVKPVPTPDMPLGVH